MTLAVGQALKECYGDYADLNKEAIKSMQQIGKQYFDCDYGGSFRLWLNSPYSEPYSSWGNGAAMRVSACAYFATSLEEAKEFIRASREEINVNKTFAEYSRLVDAFYMWLYAKLDEYHKDDIKERNYLVKMANIDIPEFSFNPQRISVAECERVLKNTTNNDN